MSETLYQKNKFFKWLKINLLLVLGAMVAMMLLAYTLQTQHNRLSGLEKELITRKIAEVCEWRCTSGIVSGRGNLTPPDELRRCMEDCFIASR